NQFAVVMEATPIEGLQGKTAVLIENPLANSSETFSRDTLDFQQSGSLLSLSYKTRTEKLAAISFSNRLLVVSDPLFDQLKTAETARGNRISRMTLYVNPESQGQPGKSDAETIVGFELNEWNKQQMKQVEHVGFVQSRAQTYYSTQQGFALISFIGVFIALIFSISSASFLYFKLHTELAADQVTYRSLSKIGLSSKEMNVSATLQIAVLFFIPIVVATLQSLVVLEPILTLIQINKLGPVLMASGAFLAAQTVYFLIARARYIKSLSSIMV
ncbi:MAG: ABC transporter permease, partial [Gorillibacterium sp.]|nr:ABC transporter permease [Gorillibacterium sp.]